MTLPPRPVLLGLAGAAILAGLLAVIVSRGDDEDPESLIRAQLERAARGAEAKDVGEVMEIVSESFGTAQLSRDDVRRALFVQLRNAGWHKVALVDVDVRVDEGDEPTRAKATFQAVLARGDSKDGTWKDLAPTDATVYAFELEFVLEDEWRVRRAVYQRASLLDP